MKGNKKLIRPVKGKMVAGVCAGIADFLGWDVTLLRIVYVLLTFLTAFSGVLVYLLLWILMPVAPKNPEENL